MTNPAPAPEPNAPTGLPATRRPRGPNAGLVGYAAALVVGAGALLAHLLGLPLPQVELQRVGPGALVIAGLALVLVGQLGLLRRRRRERRRLAQQPQADSHPAASTEVPVGSAEPPTGPPT